MNPLRQRVKRWLEEADPERSWRGRERSDGCLLLPGGDRGRALVFGTVVGLDAQLGLDEEGALEGHCACALGRAGERCDHECALAWRVVDELDGLHPLSEAVKLLQRALEEPEPDELVSRIVDAISAPRADVRSVAPDFVWLLSPGLTRDRLRVNVLVRPILKTGKPGAPRILRETEWDPVLTGNARPADGELLKLLRSGVRFTGKRPLAYPLADAAETADPFDLVQALVGHPFVGWQEPSARVEVRLVAPRMRVLEEEDGYRVELEHVSGERVEVAVGAEGVVVFDARAQQLHAVRLERERRLRLGRLPKVALVPRSLGPILAERLEAADPGIVIELPESLAGREIQADSSIRVVVEPLPTAAVLTLRVRPMPLGPACVPGEGESTIRATRDNERVFVKRDLPAEIAAARAAAERLAVPDLFLPNGAELSGDALFAVLERLDLPENREIVVEWPRDAPRVTVLAQPRVVHRVKVTNAADWFAIGGEVEVDGEAVQVARLLAASRERRKFVEISNGRFARLSRLLGNRFERLAELTYDDRHGTMLSRAALVTDAVPEDTPAPPAWKAALARAKEVGRLDVSLPAALTADLREYQREGYAWMRRLSALGLGGVLADDMGLGKTVQAIAMLLARAEEGPQLVLCPASVEFGWLRELERFAPTLKRVHLRQIDRDSLAKVLRPGRVVVASYGLLRSASQALAAVSWATVIVDEAQAVKNANTETAKAVRALPAAWKLALTGTPVENHLGDLHGILGTVAPGVFGPWEQFARVWAIPIEKFNDRDRAKALARLVQPLILRRTKGQVLSELPSRTEVRVDVVLPADERALYEAARREAMSLLAESEEEAEIGGDRRFRVLAALTRLRQFACAPHLVVPTSPRRSEKLRVLLERLQEILEEGHSALVFSSFVKQLDLVKEALADARIPHLMLTGDTATTERPKLVDAFQRGEAKVFLISLKAGGTGLNLTAADTVFILDPWWNPAVEDQAADRAHRLGQTRPVTIVRLVAKDTVEERVLSLHERKRALVAEVLGGTDVAGRLGTRELLDLLQESVVPFVPPAGSAP